jgi:hypothetical protein
VGSRDRCQYPPPPLLPAFCSNLRSQLHKQQLELRPRFPIFGGWNTDYMLNYTVPTNLYLSREGV